jgi:chromosome segregation ATPase
MTATIEQLQNENAQLQTNFANANAKIEQLESKLSSSPDNSAALAQKDKQIKDLEEKLETAKEQSKNTNISKEKEIKDLETKISQLQAQVKKLNASSNSQTNSQISDLQKKVTNLQNELNKMTKDRDYWKNKYATQ